MYVERTQIGLSRENLNTKRREKYKSKSMKQGMEKKEMQANKFQLKEDTWSQRKSKLRFTIF